MAPALLRGAAAPSNPGSPSDPLLQLWDSTVATLVQSLISPNCSGLGGELYILTGRGRLGADEDGDQCQTEPLWSAACCASLGGQSDFSVGLIREAAEGAKQVSVRQLEEALGGAELFSEGCQGAHEGRVETTADLSNSAANTIRQEVDSDSSEATDSGETDGAMADAAAHADVAQTSAADAAASEGEEQQEAMQSGEASSAEESAVEQEADRNSSSILLFVLSTAASVLTAPLRPVISTVTQLPGQVTQAPPSAAHEVRAETGSIPY